jgi:c-di-GMP-binding flagellar brake protein YcgR
MHKTFITEDNKATLACPACERSRIIDTASLMNLSRVVRLKIKCPCGHQYPTQLERRRNFRKVVNFAGTYFQAPGGRYLGRGTMAVLDLSRTGVRLRLGGNKGLRIGDKLMVEFKLDDRKRSIIRQESVVRRIDGTEMGAEFASIDPTDPNAKAIGFYLFAA